MTVKNFLTNKANVSHLADVAERKATAVAAHHDVVRTLQESSTEDQIEALDRTVGRDKPNRLHDALMQKAPAEMDRAIRKFKREGRPITVETLTEEARNTPSFVSMCRNVGLEISWFEELAKKRMEKAGL